MNPAQYQRLHAVRTRLQNTIVSFKQNAWQADTVFIKRRGIPVAVFCAVEVTTRVAWCHSYGSSHPSSSKTVELLKQMLGDGQAVDFLSTDPGSEFVGNEVKAFCDSIGVTLHIFATGDKGSKSIVESFNRTLRLLLAQWCLKHNTPNWDQEAIDQCVSEYNNRIHSGIGVAPSSVTEEIAAELRNAAWKSGEAFRKHFDKVATPGNRVRVAVSDDPAKTKKELHAHHLTRKAGQYRWTAKVYTVKGTRGWRVLLGGVPNRLFNVRDLVQAIEVDGVKEEVVGDQSPETIANIALITQQRKLRKEGLIEGGAVSRIFPVPENKTETRKIEQKMNAMHFPSAWLQDAVSTQREPTRTKPAARRVTPAPTTRTHAESDADGGFLPLLLAPLLMKMFSGSGVPEGAGVYNPLPPGGVNQLLRRLKRQHPKRPKGPLTPEPLIAPGPLISPGPTHPTQLAISPGPDADGDGGFLPLLLAPLLMKMFSGSGVTGGAHAHKKPHKGEKGGFIGRAIRAAVRGRLDHGGGNQNTHKAHGGGWLERLNDKYVDTGLGCCSQCWDNEYAANPGLWDPRIAEAKAEEDAANLPQKLADDAARLAAARQLVKEHGAGVTGGSQASAYVAKMIAQHHVDPSKVTHASAHLKSMKKRRAGPKEGDRRKNRVEIVKRVMQEKGLPLIAASQYVKAHGLY